jgi:hypothetical protein
MRYLVKNVSLILILFCGFNCSSKLPKSFIQKKHSTQPSEPYSPETTPEYTPDTFLTEPYVLVFASILLLIALITWISVRMCKN